MSTFKKFTSNDVIVTPFAVNKSFSYSGVVPSYNDNGPFLSFGKVADYPLGGGEEGTGSQALVYHSIKQLYYSNFISGSNGQISNAATTSFNSDGTISGPIYTTNYNNGIQSIYESRSLTKTPNDFISVLSIPVKQFGEYIKPGSYSDSSSGFGVFTDDGEGNLISESVRVGNIFYGSGLVVYNRSVVTQDPQWESTITLYETQYKCTIRSNEYNYSLNPSLISSSLRGQNKILDSGSAQYEDFVTGSDFSPYVTTIGLYDDEQNLLAVAKLAQPLPTSQTTDTTILINLDR